MAKFKYYNGSSWIELFPASGGDISGHIYLTGANANSSTANTSQLVFGTAANNHVAISSNTDALIINPTTASTTGQILMYVGSNPRIIINRNEVATQEWVGQQNYLTWANLGTAAALDYTTSVTSGSGDLVTSGAVYDAIAGLPQPMVFKGTIGTNGTYAWDSLPTANASHEGWTLKAITTNDSMQVKTGDTIVCANLGTAGSPSWTWVVIPSGDEPSGTVTNVGLSMPSIFTVSGSPVTSSGTLTASLSTQSANKVFAGPTTGSAAAPTFRSLVAEDLPAHSHSDYVPYTGASNDVNLGSHSLAAGTGFITGNITIQDVTNSNVINSFISTSNTNLVLNPDGYLYYGSVANDNEVATHGWVENKGYATASSLGTAAAKNYTTSVTSENADLVTSGAVYSAISSAISNLPSPMLFKGGATITKSGSTYTVAVTSPSSASSILEGYTYKITSAPSNDTNFKVGDTLIANQNNPGTNPQSHWTLIPSGDEPSGTVTSVGLTNYSSGTTSQGTITISDSPVTSSGTINIKLATAYGDTVNPYGTKSPHYVLAGPESGSTAAAPTFRALVAEDLPSHSHSAYVPYIDAAFDVNLGDHGLIAETVSIVNVNATAGTSTTCGGFGSSSNGDLFIEGSRYIFVDSTSGFYVGTTTGTNDANKVATQGWVGTYYLPLAGGTLTGVLNVKSISNNRANINLVSVADVPNDLYFGSNDTKHWSLTSRDSSESNAIGLYSTSQGIGYVWKTSYSTGITDFKYRPTYNGTQLALTSELPSVTSYFWADQQISSTSSKGTTPTVSTITVGGSGSTAGKVTMQYNTIDECLEFVFA